MNAAQLDHTAKVLAEMLTFKQPSDAVLSAYFREHKKLGRQDRHEIAETAFAALRHYQKISTALRRPHAQPRKAALAALVLGRSTNISQIKDLLDEEETEFLGNLKARKTKFSDGLNTAATPYSPWGIRLKNKIALNKHELFLDGTLEVQDEGSQLLALLVGAKRGEIIVDFCAGAGGKTLAVGAQMANKGRIYAFDIAEKRLANLKPRMTRAGLTNIHPERISSEHDTRIARLAGKADRVLVDAPCSGLGTLRRNPDLKYRQSAETVANLLAQQHSILDAASKLVKPQGRLVYATCSVLPEENELQVERFLSEHPEFELVNCAELLQSLKVDLDTGKYLRLNSGEHQTDGFFAAILQRK